MINNNRKYPNAGGKEKEYLKVSPTAYGVAFRRVLAEISYAKEIYGELEKIKAAESPEEIAKLEGMEMAELTPFFEARYKLVNKLLKENGADQILEVAAGFSPRGISMTEENVNLKYAELDLKPITQEKEQINKILLEQGVVEPRSNHFLEHSDALDLESLNNAARHFDKKPIAVVNEGLMRYLTFEQKTQYAKNVAALLKKFGGVWITPDITLKGMIKFARERTAKLSKDLQVDIDANLFEDETHSRKFFEDLGLIIEVHPFREIKNELVSPGKLGTSAEALSDMLDLPVAYAMRLKP